MAAWVAWPFPVGDDNLQKSRLIQLLLEGWRDGRNRGMKLPPDAVDLLTSTTGKSARDPPSFRDMLKALDKPVAVVRCG